MSTLQEQVQSLAKRIAQEFNTIRADITTTKNNILGSGVTEAYDTIKEVADKALANKELIDKLETTANVHVAYTTQSKTDSEKTVARTNIGAISSSDVDTKISTHNSDSSAHSSLISHVDTVKASIDSTAQTVATNATKAQTSEANAKTYATNANNSATSSANNVLDAKAWAEGTTLVDGTSITSAKQYASNASSSATIATTKASEASTSATNAASAATEAANTAIETHNTDTEAHSGIVTEIKGDISALEEEVSDLQTGASTASEERDILKRRVRNLELASQGITHTVEEDSDTAYSKTVPSGAMPSCILDSISGRSLVWNQILDKQYFTSGTINGIKYTVSDYEINISGEATANAYINIGAKNSKRIAGHKYYIKGCPYTGSSSSYMLNLWIGDVSFGANDIGNGVIVTIPSSTTTTTFDGLYIYVKSGTVVSSAVFRPQIFDLTQMFGAGNEPSSNADIEQLIEYQDYWPYNEGEIVHSAVDSVESVGADGTTALQTLTVPDAIKNLPGYGWSAGSVYNKIDYDNRIYVQNVKNYNLGDMAWTYIQPTDSSYGRFISKTIEDMITNTSYSLVPNLIINEYNTVAWNKIVTKNDNVISLIKSGVSNFIGIVDTRYTDIVSFINAVSGFLLYYETSSPIETPFRLIKADGINDGYIMTEEEASEFTGKTLADVIPDSTMLTVEEGGTMTFKSTSDLHIAVPSTESYMVKTSS